MRKLLIFIGLFLTLSLSGQIRSGVVSSQGGGVAAPGDGEMLTNGALTSGTSWTFAGGFTLVGDAAVFDDVSVGGFYQLPADMVTNLVANTAYTLTFDLSGTSGGGIYLAMYSADNGDGSVFYITSAEYTNGAKSVNFTTPADVKGGGLLFYGQTIGDSGGTIDNISLKLQ